MKLNVGLFFELNRSDKAFQIRRNFSTLMPELYVLSLRVWCLIHYPVYAVSINYI